MRTSLYSILCILIRLGAVIIAVSTIVVIPAAWTSAEMSQVEGYAGMLVAFAGAMLVLAAVLWIYPGVLARIAAGRSSQQIFESAISAEEFQQIAFAIVGVWFVIEALADIAGTGARIIVTSYMSTGMEGGPLFAAMFRHEYSRLVPLAVKVALGIALAIGARGLVGWIRGLRERGLPAPAIANADDANDRGAG